MKTPRKTLPEFSALRARSALVGACVLILTGCGIQMKNSNFSEEDMDPFFAFTRFGLIQFDSTTPASPGSGMNPRVRGSITVPTAQVALFSDVACLNPLGSGTSAEFHTLGIEASVGANTLTAIYGKGIHGNGAASTSCTLLANYTHDDIPPTLTLSTPARNAILNASNSVLFSGTCSENGRQAVLS